MSPLARGRWMNQNRDDTKRERERERECVGGWVCVYLHMRVIIALTALVCTWYPTAPFEVRIGGRKRARYETEKDRYTKTQREREREA